MNLPRTMLYSFGFLLTAGIGIAYGVVEESYTIRSNEDFERVESLVKESEAAQVRITIEEGDYTLVDTFHLNRSRVSLIGVGNPRLVLASGLNKAAIAIGTQIEVPHESTRTSEEL